MKGSPRRLRRSTAVAWESIVAKQSKGAFLGVNTWCQHSRHVSGTYCRRRARKGIANLPVLPHLSASRHLHWLCILSTCYMAQPATQSSTLQKPEESSSAGRIPNGRYVNGTTAAPDASAERTQIINDEKEFRYALRLLHASYEISKATGVTAKTWTSR